MPYEVRDADGYKVVVLNEEVDLSCSPEARKTILDALGDGGAVFVDLSAVTYIDSSGVASLVEGFQIWSNVVDVVVCDGFVGNILLKGSESLFRAIQGILREELGGNTIRKTGALLAKGAFRSMKKRLDPEEFGAAPLLGLKGHVLKAHGSSNRFSFASAIKIAKELLQQDLIEGIAHDVRIANNIMQDLQQLSEPQSVA